jgi:ABC-type antimicrobial peptide transport system permease subunit
MILAVAGIYGVVSLAAIQRTREIGVRVSVGAASSDIVLLVLRRGLVLAAAGIVAGLAASVALNRFLGAILFNVGAADPLTLAAASILLFGAAGLACYAPARRASKVDPVQALRFE